MWNVADGTPISRLGRQLEENADDLQFSPDGKWLAAGTSHGARVWTLRPGAEQAVFRAVDVFDSHFALSPDGTWLAIACSKPLYEQGMNPLLFEERVRIVDTATGAERAAFQGVHREGIRGIDIFSRRPLDRDVGLG
ncbi:MAG: hypothetical protein U0872_00470 [Planctomycetaceae bacterium]